MAPFVTFCGATDVSQIHFPSFFFSLTMVHLTWPMAPTKVAAHMTF
jgi:hypothetical protein